MALSGLSEAPWHVRITKKDYERLTASDAPEGWETLKEAAKVLKVSQQTIVQRLNTSRLEGVRVLVGGRSGSLSEVAQAGEFESQQQVTIKTQNSLIQMVVKVTHYETHCPRCGAEMRVVSVITEPVVIDKILSHIAK